MAYSQYFKGIFVFKAPNASISDTTPPTFSGVTSVSQQTDGSLNVIFGSATDATTPIRYEVYVQKSTATGLFSTLPQKIVSGSPANVRMDYLGNYFQVGDVVYVSVRAVDAVGNKDTNTATANDTITYSNFNSLAAYVWDILRASHNVSGSFGEALQAKVDVDVSTRAVESTVAKESTLNKVKNLTAAGL